MLLQLALDDPGYLAVIGDVADLVDIFEVGTPLLKRFGLGGVSTVLERAGGRPVLVDSKTVDGGAKEARMFFGVGAALMTVLSVASEATHTAVNEIAKDHGGYVVVDTLCAERFPRQRIAYPDRFAYLGLHLATDRRVAGEASTSHIAAIPTMHALGYLVSIAGGISARNIEEVVKAAPEIVVVGSAITQADNPRRAAQWISSQLVDRGLGWPPAPKSSN